VWLEWCKTYVNKCDVSCKVFRNYLRWKSLGMAATASVVEATAGFPTSKLGVTSIIITCT